MRFRNLMEGMKVSVLSLGGSSFGGVYDDDVKQDEVNDIVRKTLKRGVNLIDTAPWYGQGVSEKVLGIALSHVPRDSYYMFTKVGRYDLDVETMFDFRAERVERSVEESMTRLNLNFLDCVQVHDPEFAPNLDIIVNETVPALQRLKEKGIIGMIGMTGYDLAIQREIIERCEDHSGIKIDTSLTYCHYSMNDTTLIEKMKDYEDSYLEFARKRKIGLINASSLSMGLLTNQGPPDWHPATSEIRSACRDAAAYCKSKSIDISKLALYFTLSCESVSTTLVSFASKKIADQCVDFASKDFVLTNEEHEVLKTRHGNLLRLLFNSKDLEQRRTFRLLD